MSFPSIFLQSTIADTEEEGNEGEEDVDEESDVELEDGDQSSNSGNEDKITDYSDSF